jgi:hypothetical protein
MKDSFDNEYKSYIEQVDLPADHIPTSLNIPSFGAFCQWVNQQNKSADDSGKK